MAVVGVAIVPVGTGSPSLSSYITQCIRILTEEGVKYELHPMGTTIEGKLDTLLALIKKMHEAAFKEGAIRVITSIQIDNRRDKKATSEEIVKSVLFKL